jgi:hypothetical protein
LRHAGALEEALGASIADAYTLLITHGTNVDVRVGRELAAMVPEQVARVPSEHRQRYLRALRWVVSQRAVAAPMIAQALPDLVERLEDAPLQAFLLQAIERQGESASKGERFLKGESETGRATLERLESGTALRDVSRVLSHYARAHCGEDIRIASNGGVAKATGRGFGQAGYATGHDVMLPERVDIFGDERDFLVYRVSTAHTVGYLEFGTFDLQLSRLGGEWPMRLEGESEIERLLRAFPNQTIARDLLQLAEDTRVEAAVRRAYPGVARDLDIVRPALLESRDVPLGSGPAEQVLELVARRIWGVAPSEDERGLDPNVQQVATELVSALVDLREVEATVEDTVHFIQAAWPAIDGLMRHAEAGDPPSDGSGGGGRRRNSTDDSPPEEPNPPEPQEPSGIGGTLGDAGDEQRSYSSLPTGGELRPEARTDEQKALDDEVQAMLEALEAAQKGEEGQFTNLRRRLMETKDERSYEEMEAWLERIDAPVGGRVDSAAPEHREQGQVEKTLLEGVNAPLEPREGVLYSEWDHTLDDYKPNWACVKEYTLEPGDRTFVDRCLETYGPLVHQIRAQFEALRPDAFRPQRGMSDGDDIDIDAVIRSRTQVKAGGAALDGLYLRRVRRDRDVAVAFLVDLSSSTNETANADGKCVLDVEKEALILAAEAVNAIGDSCAIYGFSGYGREQVAFYVAKRFDEPYDNRIQERIGRMKWKMENRDGAAIRHATQKLLARPSRVKLLLLLSDGRPLDCGCDHYQDRVAHEDTRMALLEARQQGVHPFCITVDPRGQTYLERMYGQGGYTIIDRVEALPRRLPAIYRRLTR